MSEYIISVFIFFYTTHSLTHGFTIHMNFLETFYILCISSFCINFGRIFYGATWNKTAQIKLFVSFCYYFFFSFIFIQHIRICIRYTHLHSIHITTHDTLKIHTYIKNYQFITYTFVQQHRKQKNTKENGPILILRM